MISGKLRNELLERIAQLEFAPIKEGHQCGDADRLGDRAQKKHRILTLDLSERSRERILPLNHVQHCGGDLAFARYPRQNFSGFVRSLAPQRSKQGGPQTNCEAALNKPASCDGHEDSLRSRVGNMKSEDFVPVCLYPFVA